jgi:hypothetical protein
MITTLTISQTSWYPVGEEDVAPLLLTCKVEVWVVDEVEV